MVQCDRNETGESFAGFSESLYMIGEWLLVMVVLLLPFCTPSDSTNNDKTFVFLSFSLV